MIDYRLALMAGADIPIPECEITLHQPKIKEISYIGESDFFVGAQCLCVNKSMYSSDNQLLNEVTNFEVFMTIMQEKSVAEKRKSTEQVLSLLFPNYRVAFTPRALLLNKDGINAIIDENNFEILQQVFEQIFCLKHSGQQNFNPGNEAARKIAEKLMRARERVAKQKDGGADASVLSQYLSILTVGLSSMSLQDCLDLTLYQLYDLVERYTLYVNWDIDLRSRLAGGKPDSQPDNWMKIIH